jgi:NodT family efflux transporter outer membrane factor (OMF) lipoprotein
MKRSFFLATAVATLLAGCNLAPTYVRPVGEVPATLPQGGIYPVAPTDAADVSSVGWRDFFVDPRLREVIDLGLANNRDLRIAAANVLQARALYRIQRADRFPTVGASAGVTYSNNIGGFGSQGVGGTRAIGGGTVGGGTVGGGTGVGTGTGTGGSTTGGGTAGGNGSTTGAGAGLSGGGDTALFSLGVGVSAFELDLFGRVRNLSRAALEQYLATEEARRSIRISLIAEIASAYLAMAADGDRLQVAQRTLESFRQSLDLTRAQFRIGVASELEARQAETNYEAARNDIAALRTQIARDANALNLLAGITVPAPLLPDSLGARDYALANLPAGVDSAVLLHRPDVLQAEHQLIAQNANIGAARAAFFPTISLTAALGTISTSLGGLFGGNSRNWSVGPSASLPIFDFGRTRGNLRYTEASREAAVGTYERTVQTAFREVADALAERGTINEQVRAREARANAAAVAARLSDARYRAGVDSFLVSLDAQRTAYAAQLDLAATRLARQNNLVELYRSLGGGLNDTTVAASPARP